MDKKVTQLRNQFEIIDQNILLLLNERYQLSKKMAQLKKAAQLDIVQPQHWKQQIENRLRDNERIHLNAEFVEGIFNLIHNESVRIQQLEISTNE